MTQEEADRMTEELQQLVNQISEKWGVHVVIGACIPATSEHAMNVSGYTNMKANELQLAIQRFIQLQSLVYKRDTGTSFGPGFSKN